MCNPPVVGPSHHRHACADKWLRQVVLSTPVPTFVIDSEHRVILWNLACEMVTGTPASAVIGTSNAWKAFYPEARPVMADLIVDGVLAEEIDVYYGGKRRTSATMPDAWEAEDFFPNFPDGGKWLAFSAAPLFDEGGALVGAIETLRDITNEKRAAQAQAESEHRLAEIIDGCPVPMFVIDESHRVTHWNRACEAIIGMPKDQIIGTRDQWLPFYPSKRPVMADLVVDGNDETAVRALYSGKYRPSGLIAGAWEATDLFPHFRNGARWLYFTAAPIHGLDGRNVGAVETLQDVTEQKDYEHRLRHQATHDALTGLSNRVLFEDRLTQALAHAQRDERLLALLFIDLDNFKAINDTLGHTVGDEVVRVAANRIAKAVRAGDTVARLGGDEFVVLLVSPESENSVGEVIERLIGDVAAPMEVGGQELFIGCSIGAALYPNDGLDAGQLLMHADAAMYRAKQSGRGTFQFFTPQMNEDAVERMELERDLHRAFERQELDIHFQPQVNLFTGAIVGAEALLRWNHPRLGMIPPDRFIPLAEEAGLMASLGRWVLDTACFLGRQWTADGRRLRLAVNLSPSQLHHPDIVREITDAAAKYATPSLYLELELTESTVMRSATSAARILSALKECGIRLSMDDFGTGHSSLANLHSFPFDMIKIDRSFIDRIGADEGAEAIIKAVIALADALELAVIAEGVETEGQAAFLRSANCIEAQGFYFGRPMPAEDLTRLLARESSGDYGALSA